MSSPVPHVALLPALVVGMCACSAGSRPGPSGDVERHYPWVLQDPSAFGSDFLWRQRLVAQFGGDELSLQAVMQKRGNVLTIIGIGPAGNKAFVLTQKGQAVSFRLLMPRALPFPPRFILHDIQRAWLPLNASTPAPADGIRHLAVPEELARETYAGGRRIKRVFKRRSGQPRGTIEVIYLPPTRVGLPGTVKLRNGWFRYRLVIETLEARPL